VLNPKSLSLDVEGEFKLGSGDVPIDEVACWDSDEAEGESVFDTLEEVFVERW